MFVYAIYLLPRSFYISYRKLYVKCCPFGIEYVGVWGGIASSRKYTNRFRRRLEMIDLKNEKTEFDVLPVWHFFDSLNFEISTQ